jgi:hypothetical protein
LRIEYPGAFHDLTSRGEQRGVYFGMKEEDDKLSEEVNRIIMAMAQRKCIV